MQELHNLYRATREGELGEEEPTTDGYTPEQVEAAPAGGSLPYRTLSSPSPPVDDAESRLADPGKPGKGGNTDEGKEEEIEAEDNQDAEAN